MQSGGVADAADESIDPSDRKNCGPHDDNPKRIFESSVTSVVKELDLFRALGIPAISTPPV